MQTKVTLQDIVEKLAIAQKWDILAQIGSKRSLCKLIGKSPYNLFLKYFSFEISQKLLEQ